MPIINDSGNQTIFLGEHSGCRGTSCTVVVSDRSWGIAPTGGTVDPIDIVEITLPDLNVKLIFT